MTHLPPPPPGIGALVAAFLAVGIVCGAYGLARMSLRAWVTERRSRRTAALVVPAQRAVTAGTPHELERSAR